MTSFDVFESSQQSGRPIELYSIAVGSTTYRYTSAEDEITIGADTYEPIAISRTGIVQAAEERSRTVTVTVPGDNIFVRRYIDVVPGDRATVSIFRLQRDEVPAFDTQVLIYKGTVHAVGFPNDGATAEISVRSLEAAANRSIPRWTYMGMCNHILYDTSTGCNADPDDPQFKLTGDILTTVGSVITVSGANSQPDGWWSGGFCKPAGISDFRLILQHVGNNLVLLLPFTGDLTGSSVVLQAGCDHTFLGDCAAKFDRAIDFGGFPFVPSKDIWRGGVKWDRL